MKIEIENEVIKDKNLVALLECLQFIYFRVEAIAKMLQTSTKITQIKTIESDLKDIISTLRAFSLAEQADNLNEITQKGQQQRFDFILEKMKRIKDNVDVLTIIILGKENDAKLLLQLYSMKSIVSYIQKWIPTLELSKQNYLSDTEVKKQHLLFSLRKSSEELRCLFSGNKKNMGYIQGLNTLNNFEQRFTYKAELLYAGKLKTIYNFHKEEGKICSFEEMYEMLNKLKVDFINQNNNQSICETNVKIIIETIIEMKQTISSLILDKPQKYPKIEKNL